MDRYLAAVMMSATVLASSASAGMSSPTELVLSFDRPQLMELPTRPATVVIGNAGVADVTLDGQTLFIHPRSYGFTSLLVLDAEGATIGDYTVRVTYEDPLSVSVYTPSGRKTYTCAGDCERTLRIGDENRHTSAYVEDSGMKSAFASGQGEGDSAEVLRPASSSSTAAPPAPASAAAPPAQ